MKENLLPYILVFPMTEKGQMEKCLLNAPSRIRRQKGIIEDIIYLQIFIA